MTSLHLVLLFVNVISGAEPVLTAIALFGSIDCDVSYNNFEGVDVGINATDSVRLSVRNTRVSGVVAIKGARVKGLKAENVIHTFMPMLSPLTRAIRREINGYV